MTTNRFTLLIAAATTAFALSAGAAEPTTITKDEAKSLKAQSEGQYKARKNVAEANEDLNRADCKSALEGSAKRACEKSAKHAAKSDKAAAKAVHEMEEKKIDDAKK
jgi:DNA-directed RNA polymerase subunit K/omega